MMRRIGLVVMFAAFALAAPAARGAPEKADPAAEIEALTTALAAQLRLAGIYEELGRPEELAATRRAILDLVDRQQAMLQRIRTSLEGPQAPVPSPAAAEGPVRDLAGVRDRALRWLATVQAEDGSFRTSAAADDAPFSAGPAAGASPLYTPGVTGLALLAFLNAGQTHQNGEYRETVANGLKYLTEMQDPEGCFGPRTSTHFIYNHGYATLAMTQAFHLTSTPLYKAKVRGAVDFIRSAQNPYLGWRYGVRPGDNDTSVTSLMAVVLAAAKQAGIEVDQAPFDGARAWLDKMTDPASGRVGYVTRGSSPARTMEAVGRFPADDSESLTAAAIVARLAMGEKPDSEIVRKGRALILAKLPGWQVEGRSMDMYYWYWGTLALRSLGGDWTEWRAAMTKALFAGQEKAGPDAGSFPPVGPWGQEGGRVYSTALLAMIASHLLGS